MVDDDLVGQATRMTLAVILIGVAVRPPSCVLRPLLWHRKPLNHAEVGDIDALCTPVVHILDGQPRDKPAHHWVACLGGVVHESLPDMCAQVCHEVSTCRWWYLMELQMQHLMVHVRE